MQNITQKNIKDHNLITVFRHIASQETTNRQELSEVTGLSRVTVGKIVDLLLKANFVDEKKDNSARVGRKENLVSMADVKKRILVIDISAYETSISLLKLNLSIDFDVQYEYNPNISYTSNLNKSIRDFIDSCLKNNLEDIIGVSVIIPGPYYADEDKVINTRIHELEHIRLAKVIQSHFYNKPIIIDEDVNFSARYNSFHFGNDRKLFYAFIGRGVGGAIIYDGDIFESAHSYAGEIGQIQAQNGVAFEDILSTENLKILQEKNANNIELEQYFSKCSKVLAEMFSIVTWLVDPEFIVVESVYNNLDPIFVEKISDELNLLLSDKRSGHIPQVVPAVTQAYSSHYGAGMKTVERYLSEL